MGSPLRLRVLGYRNCWELEFVAGGGGLDAAEAQVEAHTSNAILITGDAEADGLGTALACFAREGGIADLAAYDIYHIGQAFAQDAFGLYGVFDTPGTENGKLDYFANARRDEELISRRRVHRALYHVEVVKFADTGVDEIELARGFQAFGDFEHVIKRQPGRDQLVTAQADTKREVTPDLGAYSLDYFQGKAHTV